MLGVRMEWSNDGELLAVAGYVRLPDQDCRNELRFYRRSTKLQLALVLPTQVRLSLHYYNLLSFDVWKSKKITHEMSDDMSV